MRTSFRPSLSQSTTEFEVSTAIFTLEHELERLRFFKEHLCTFVNKCKLFNDEESLVKPSVKCACCGGIIDADNFESCFLVNDHTVLCSSACKFEYDEPTFDDDFPAGEGELV